MPITHTDGAEYFSKSEIETIVKDRVKSVETTRDEWVGKYKAVEPQLAQLQTLSTELATWKEKATKVEGRLARVSAATSHGVTDADTMEALEASYEKAMGRVEEGKRIAFDAYLGLAKSDPTVLPTYLRSVFAGGQGGEGAGKGQEVDPSKKAGPGAGEGGDKGGAERPAWAPAVSGQRTVTPGGTPKFAERVSAAKTLDDLQAISAERRAARGR